MSIFLVQVCRSINDPLAVLISRDNFVGYQTADQAEADNKHPFP